MSEHGEHGKFRTVLTWVVIAMILLLILVWLLAGGISAALKAGANFTNPVNFFFGNGTSTGQLITLPWQPPSVRGPDISQYVQEEDQELARINGEGSQGSPLSFGNASPYHGDITIVGGDPGAAAASQQYLELDVSGNAPAPVDLTGWSLQSAVSGLRVYLPEGAPIFVAGTVNSTEQVVLSPGQSAIISTGESPIGVSFQENVCTGYLAQLQPFTPALSESCPAPSSALSDTPQNEQAYGTPCFEYLSSLPACVFPSQVPAGLSSACTSFVQNTFSYNGCVKTHRAENSFALPVWRLYLNLRAPVWYATHDTVRLLDAQGQIVDAYSY